MSQPEFATIALMPPAAPLIVYCRRLIALATEDGFDVFETSLRQLFVGHPDDPVNLWPDIQSDTEVLVFHDSTSFLRKVPAGVIVPEPFAEAVCKLTGAESVSLENVWTFGASEDIAKARRRIEHRSEIDGDLDPPLHRWGYRCRERCRERLRLVRLKNIDLPRKSEDGELFDFTDRDAFVIDGEVRIRPSDVLREGLALAKGVWATQEVWDVLAPTAPEPFFAVHWMSVTV